MTATALRGRDLLLVLVVCTVWAIGFLTSAHALREIPPFLFTSMRTAMVILVLAAFLKVPPRSQWGRLSAIAMLSGVLYFGTSFLAIKLAGNLSSPALVSQAYVPMAVLLAWWLLGEKFGWRTGIGVALSFVGILVLGFDPMLLDRPVALSVMLVSALVMAAGTILMRGLKGMDAMNLQGWVALLSLLPLLAISALVEPQGLGMLQKATWIGWGGAAYSALFATVIGHGLLYWLVQRHPVALVMPYLLLMPVIAVVLGIFWWGDRPGPALWAGGSMILIGVLIVSLRKAPVRGRLPPDAV